MTAQTHRCQHCKTVQQLDPMGDVKHHRLRRRGSPTCPGSFARVRPRPEPVHVLERADGTVEIFRMDGYRIWPLPDEVGGPARTE